MDNANDTPSPSASNTIPEPARHRAPENQDRSSFDHLVIVCCHAIYTGNGDGEDESDWYPTTILSLIAKTLALTLLPPSSPLTRRLHTEPSSTDSYQNLLFSILHFHHLTTHYPLHITLITHLFKRRRFLELHAPAIRWPVDKIQVLGIDPPERVSCAEGLRRGEERDGYGVWKGDLYGCGRRLRGKRVGRGWREEEEEELEVMGEGCEEGVKELLRWEGGESGVQLFPGDLPWATPDSRLSDVASLGGM
ncbi:MAG: hypothetical protein M1836_002753 [Candelina mexicana]|nr:MAG: hypothetical protein M1836_002753 [Candelina mexicana]